MPHCFQLSRVDSVEFTPVSFTEIDNELCECFGVKPDRNFYFRNWYGTIGFALSWGHTFEDIKAKKLGDPEICDWMKSRFVSASWASR